MEFNKRLLLVGIAIITLFSYTGTMLHLIEGEVRSKTGESLTTVLNTTHKAVEHFAEKLTTHALAWGNQPDVVGLTETLLATNHNRPAPGDAQVRKQLGDFLSLSLTEHEFENFFLIGPDYINLISSNDEYSGAVSLLANETGVLERVFAGESVLSLHGPMVTGGSLRDRDGSTIELKPRNFVVAPVRSGAGEVIAALAYSIDLSAEFTEMLSFGRIGKSGETYAFDRQGLLLSESRFDPLLRRSGLIGPDQAGIRNLRLSDPGRLLQEGVAVEGNPASWPLTRSVASATAGYDGVVLEPYRDYRGINVIGAWLWDESLAIGMTTEIDAQEAFADYRASRKTLLVLSGLSAGMVILLYAGFERRRLQHLRQQREIELLELEYRQLFENVGVAIWNEDLREVLAAFDHLRQSGVEDLKQYLQTNPAEVERLIGAVRIVRLNSAATALFGAGTPGLEDEVRKQVYNSVGREVLVDRLCAIWGGGSVFSAEINIQLSSGNSLRVIYSHMLPDPGLEITRVPVSIVDITDWRNAEAQVIQSSKLAMLGEMATSVSHELNQPLNVIALAANNLIRHLDGAEIDPEYLGLKADRILAQVTRASKVTDHMRNFGRLSTEPADQIDPLIAIREAINMISSQLRLSQIQLDMDLPDKCPLVRGHVVQLEQVILNLLVNAIDAISAHSDPVHGWIRVSLESDSSSVWIAVEDSGGGIPDNMVSRIFEPFFTTKKSGEGTGLGLSVSFGIIRDMGGNLSVSQGKEGARFLISLPANLVPI